MQALTFSNNDTFLQLVTRFCWNCDHLKQLHQYNITCTLERHRLSVTAINAALERLRKKKKRSEQSNNKLTWQFHFRIQFSERTVCSARLEVK